MLDLIVSVPHFGCRADNQIQRNRGNLELLSMVLCYLWDVVVCRSVPSEG